MINEEFKRDVQKLNMLLSVKNQFEKQLNFQMSMFLKKDKINKIICKVFDRRCNLEMDMRRNLSVINILSNKIDGILDDYNINFEDYEKYADFILENNYSIE